ncbi:MAG TPA: hypothetical protein PKO12_02925, partial [Holophaga sp.]|nr:hypothetical protein [Holophaga sp.]
SEKLGGPGGLEGLAAAPLRDAWEDDLRRALMNLGFREETVAPVLATLRTERPPLPEAIRRALKALQR